MAVLVVLLHEGVGPAVEATAGGTRTKGLSRRQFLAASAATGGLIVVSGGLGMLISSRRSEAVTAAGGPAPPAPLEPLASVKAGADLGIDGVTPFITPNDAFYRVDTALQIPTIAPATGVSGSTAWSIARSSFDARGPVGVPTIERDITLTCVSNEVGGDYAGTARWLGIPLATSLRRPGCRRAPTRSSRARRRHDDRHPDRGRPRRPRRDARHRHERRAAAARPRLPGPDGRARASTATSRRPSGWSSSSSPRFDAYDAVLGRARLGHGRRRSRRCRASTPRGRSRRSPPAGRHRRRRLGAAPRHRQGRGPRRRRRLAGGPARDVDTIDTWRQWVLDWDATPGRHTLEVRATDAHRRRRSRRRAPTPFPEGATGWHSVVMTVT